MSAQTSSSWLRCRAEEAVLAFALLTRLPLPGLAIRPEAKLCDYVWAFPVAGLAVGQIGASVLLLTRALGVSPAMAALAALAVIALATGALHEDGLADFCDGIGGGRTRERKLEIMRDSRIGSYGAVALMLATAARWTALSELADPQLAASVLVLASTLARGLLVIMIEYWRPARTDGLAAAGGRCHPLCSGITVVLSVGISLALTSAAVAGIALACAALAIIAIGFLAQRHLGGYTGDAFGAAEQLAEVSVLAAAATLMAH